MTDEPTTNTSPPEPGPVTEATKPDPSLINQPAASSEPTEDKSLLNQPGPATAPEKYEDFTVPDGYEMDAEALTEATGVFKELGLSQAAAQRLVELYSKRSIEAANAPIEFYKEMQSNWIKEVKADPEIGGKLDAVRTTVARAIDGLGDPKLATDFRAAMDLTGAGNNPAIIRGFYKLAQKVTEPTGAVTGAPKGTTERPRNAAQAIYPNLPTGG